MRSIGVDLVEFAKAERLWRSAGAGLRRALSDSEWKSVRRSRRPARRLAALLACKEALFKSQGKPWMGPDGFREIRTDSGRVSLKRSARYVVATCLP